MFIVDFREEKRKHKVSFKTPFTVLCKRCGRLMNICIIIIMFLWSPDFMHACVALYSTFGYISVECDYI